jgi:hypothetical protein
MGRLSHALTAGRIVLRGLALIVTVTVGASALQSVEIAVEHVRG